MIFNSEIYNSLYIWEYYLFFFFQIFKPVNHEKKKKLINTNNDKMVQ